MTRVRRLTFPLVVLVAAFAIAATACSSGGGSGAKGTTTVPPESIKLPIAQVRALLPGMVTTGNDAATAAAAGDFAKAKHDAAAVLTTWYKVEGTVRDRDADTYVSIEDAQARMQNGSDDHDADQVAAGARDQADQVEAFLAANPA